MGWWSSVGFDSFRVETYGDVKTLGNNVQGRILRGRIVQGRNILGRIVPVPSIASPSTTTKTDISPGITYFCGSRVP
jgi:hypothetical protein